MGWEGGRGAKSTSISVGIHSTFVMLQSNTNDDDDDGFRRSYSTGRPSG